MVSPNVTFLFLVYLERYPDLYLGGYAAGFNFLNCTGNQSFKIEQLMGIDMTAAIAELDRLATLVDAYEA